MISYFPDHGISSCFRKFRALVKFPAEVNFFYIFKTRYLSIGSDFVLFVYQRIFPYSDLVYKENRSKMGEL
ncbi:hypothetical protein LEP1GSC047_3614 [Leptospira inadai serovar Lyme str. 10]|uniref:Uncharacterized protein n=2 Tax=Leptospira inadai serovar Lyme TaxID=293084 RepID=V6HDS6_9LEPT|nr:hypothetical protein LEP1GSC047_3614 [Leptospira inadai serovar Lyme str. 10]PNV74969.1 hypothetical protein BES34_010370 [Leptospira inadai serovar Lyme]